MGAIAKGIPRGCHGSFTPVSLGYPLSVFNKNSPRRKKERNKEECTDKFNTLHRGFVSSSRSFCVTY